ncbi:sporulation integral membrane protein YtvI [Acidaminobacter sp. JC074]|uniref:sporulation integral membrane protein YtvI n=1 Tax=Acidaminobacter sp. JC074 TaxID=2530199 RepID=UPI001F0DAB5E|nr:sporulation integral membrane protein YtvI [Acidaminobacter sp. JC074]MCH4889493.1 sporulation integral membrane protein YtvI [Acidaminobacter sp. JC074]
MGHFTSKLVLLLIVLLAIVGIAYFGFKLILLWMPFIFAWWISNLLSPLVELLHKKIRIHKGLITFIILILFIGILLLIVSFLGFTIINQARIILDKIPEISEILEENLLSASKNLITFRTYIPALLAENLDLDIPGILQNINLSVSTILASLVGTVTFIPNLLVGIIVTFVAAFFMTKDKMKLKEMQMQLLSHKFFREQIVKIFKEDVIMVLLGYLRAQLIMMTLTFIEVSIGLFILKIPYAILIGLAIGILDALPVFGTGTVFIPWVIILLFYKNYSLAIGIFVVYLIATLGRQSLEPKIISTQIGIHPLITLLIIYSGIKIFGVAGIIIAPLIAITLMAIRKAELLKLN